jgi:hypothetical protein
MRGSDAMLKPLPGSMVALMVVSLLIARPIGAEEPAETGGRMASSAPYQAESLRDPLKSLLPPAPPPTPPPSAAKAAPPPAVPPSASLQGMLWGGLQPRAIINGEVYHVGDVVAGAKIVAIDPVGVTVDVSGTTFVLTPTGASARQTGRQPTASARPAPTRNQR